MGIHAAAFDFPNGMPKVTLGGRVSGRDPHSFDVALPGTTDRGIAITDVRAAPPHFRYSVKQILPLAGRMGS